MSEPEIKEYLRRLLGPEAPQVTTIYKNACSHHIKHPVLLLSQPEWGLPDGWGTYLAALFSWALNRRVSKDEAMRCARRQPGRSWELVDEELRKLGGWIDRSISLLLFDRHWFLSAGLSDTAKWSIPLDRTDVWTWSRIGGADAFVDPIGEGAEILLQLGDVEVRWIDVFCNA